MNISTNPDDHLAQVFDHCFRRTPMPSHTRDWLARGILETIRNGTPLDESLGLTSPGRSNLQTRLLMVRRDSHLCNALERVALDAHLSSWDRCQRLAKESRRFAQTAWPRTCRLAEPPGDWPAFKQSLWHAASTGLGLPASASRLRSIVLQNHHFSQNKNPRTMLARFI